MNEKMLFFLDGLLDIKDELILGLAYFIMRKEKLHTLFLQGSFKYLAEGYFT